MQNRREVRGRRALDDVGRVNNLYAVLSRVNEAIVRIREPQRLYEEACRIAVEEGDFLLAWIGFVDPETNSIRPAATFGHHADYLTGVHISLDASVPEGRGPTGVALREGQAFINNDTENNPIMRPWRDEQLRRGFRSSASFPLKIDERTVGVITLYAGQPDYFDDEEIRLLTTLADDFSFALESAGKDQAHRELARTRLLRDVAMAASTTTSVKELACRVLDAMIEGLDLRIGTIYSYDSATESLRLLAWRGLKGASDRFATVPVTDDSTALVARAARSRAVVTTIDMPLSADRAQMLAEAGVVTSQSIAIPIEYGGSVLGSASFVFEREEAFTDAEMELFQSLTHIVGQAFEHARLFDSEVDARQEAVRELETTRSLLDAADALASPMSLSEVLDSLCRAVLRALPHKRVTLSLWNAEEGLLVTAGSQGEEPVPVGVRMSLDGLSEPARSAIEQNRPVLVDHDALGPADRGVATSYASCLALDVPLYVGDTFIGLLAVDDAGERREFAEREIAVAQSIASQAVIAVERSRLHQAEKDAHAAEVQRAARLAILRDMADLASSSLDVHTVASSAVGVVQDLFSAKQVQLRLLGHDARHLISEAVIDLADGNLERLGDIAVDADLATAVCFRSMKSQFGEDITASHVSEGSARNARDAGVRSYVLLPLIAGGRAFGTFYVAWAEPRRFSADEVSFFEAIVAELVNGLENARLFAQSQESARLSDALNAANASVHSSLDIDEVMQHALETGVKALGCEAGVVEMLDGAEWVVRYESGFTAHVIGMRLSEEQAPSATLAAVRSAPLAIDDMRGDEEFDVGFVKQYDLKSVMAVPLSVRGRTIGCALFYSETIVKHFTEAELDFGRKLGSAVSLALENARLYVTERDIAHVLQSALLTLPTSLPGFEFANSYSSATEATNVGGDFYDIFEMDGHYVGITIGDISGKGLDAAVLTSLIRNSIRAYASEEGKRPAKVLAQANQIVHRSTSTEIFATVFFAMVDRRDGRLVYANAGHPAAAVIRRDGSLERLPGTGPLLGAFAGVQFSESESCLGPEDLLFLYTDGLTEARSDGMMYGEDRLFELLHQSRSTVPEVVVGAVLADVTSYAGNRLRDDLAILAVKRSGD